MFLARRLFVFAVFFVVLATANSAHAWIENHVLGDEITVALSRTGTVSVEHRVAFHTNGNVRFRSYKIDGVAPNAVPSANSYAVPARDALSASLDSATPLTLTVKPAPSTEGEATLIIDVADDKGLRRGKYVLVLRYDVNLLELNEIKRDGAFASVAWAGLIYEDGFDNTRVTFSVPHAPTPPRAGGPSATADDTSEPEGAVFLTEVRRGSETDEVELLRAYAAKGESIRWLVRVDPRSLDVSLGVQQSPGQATNHRSGASSRPPAWTLRRVGPWGAGALALVLLLAVLKAREVAELAASVNARVPPIVPLPLWLRAPLAAVCLVGGGSLQIVFRKPVHGAVAIVLASLLTMYRPARLDSKAAMRGPGRWLAVSEREALRDLPRPAGGWLDSSTSRGKLLLLVAFCGLGAGVWRLSQVALWDAVIVAADGVFLLALFGTGTGKSMPADMTVEPARFLRALIRKLRKRKDLGDVRIVPKIRIPIGGVDADEVRLLIAPRVPLRGFTSIEIGVTYALGMGARVTMPEVLLRVVSGSPCDEAIAPLSRVGRVATGRKRDERVISFTPRFPTVRMTAEIAAAVAIRVLDRTSATAAAARDVAKRVEKQAA